MSQRAVQPSTALLVRAAHTLHKSQRELGEMFGVSLRTAHRWHVGGSSPGVAVFRRLAIAVHPLDRELAEELAQHADIPIEALVAPPTPAAVTQASDGARVFPAVPLLLDSILFASADAADQQGAAGLSHTALRAVVRAAFARARVLGLTVEEIDEAMAGSDGALLRDRPRA